MSSPTEFNRHSLAFLTVVAISLTACNTGNEENNEVVVDGSSTVFPISQAVAEEFQKQNPQAEISVAISGTGGGMKKFCGGELDIADASRPIKDEELKSCQEKKIEFIELPVALDGVAVVVNKKNNFTKCLTVEELKKIWEPNATDKLTSWKQVNNKFPNQKLKLYGPGTDSGIFDYFTLAVNGKAKASRTDYTPSANPNIIVQGVAGDKDSLGYFGVAYYEQNKNKLNLVGVQAVEGKCETPIPLQNVVKNIYKPLSRPVFIYINKKSLESKPAVKKFVEFYLDNSKKVAGDVGYIALPDEIYGKLKQKISSAETGSKFKEAKPGEPINQQL